MGWLRDRFARSYAYHYHKKAAMRAVKKSKAPTAAATTTDDDDAPPPPSGEYVYQRQVTTPSGIVRNYAARVTLEFTPPPCRKHRELQHSQQHSHDHTAWYITGKGVEVCTDDNNNNNKNAKTNFILKGRWATHAFYWIEERGTREKFLVTGTLQRCHWNATQWMAENAVYVKRWDVEKCGVPSDGDVRESILSLSSVVNGEAEKATATKVSVDPNSTKEQNPATAPAPTDATHPTLPEQTPNPKTTTTSIPEQTSNPPIPETTSVSTQKYLSTIQEESQEMAPIPKSSSSLLICPSTDKKNDDSSSALPPTADAKDDLPTAVSYPAADSRAQGPEKVDIAVDSIAQGSETENVAIDAIAQGPEKADMGMPQEEHGNDKTSDHPHAVVNEPRSNAIAQIIAELSFQMVTPETPRNYNTPSPVLPTEPLDAAHRQEEIVMHAASEQIISNNHKSNHTPDCLREEPLTSTIKDETVLDTTIEQVDPNAPSSIDNKHSTPDALQQRPIDDPGQNEIPSDATCVTKSNLRDSTSSSPIAFPTASAVVTPDSTSAHRDDNETAEHQSYYDPAKVHSKQGRTWNALQIPDDSEHTLDDSGHNVVASLLPTIREARGLINQILSKSGKSTTLLEERRKRPEPQGLPTRQRMQPQHDDDLEPVSFFIDESVFQEDDDEDYTESGPHQHFGFDASVFQDSDEEDYDAGFTRVLSSESLVEEKQELHTEVQRLNQRFELLSSSHHQEKSKTMGLQGILSS